MRKLRLDPGTLLVETFDATSAVDAARGTVRGQACLWTYESECPTRQCTAGVGTCGTSCDPNQACDCRYTYNVTCDVC
jgi:hypothetical protein